MTQHIWRVGKITLGSLAAGPRRDRPRVARRSADPLLDRGAHAPFVREPSRKAVLEYLEKRVGWRRSTPPATLQHRRPTMSDGEKDRFGDKLRDVEKAREDKFFAERDRELLQKLKAQTGTQEEQAVRELARMRCPKCGERLTTRTPARRRDRRVSVRPRHLARRRRAREADDAGELRLAVARPRTPELRPRRSLGVQRDHRMRRRGRRACDGNGGDAELTLTSRFRGLTLGESIAVNGACMTVTTRRGVAVQRGRVGREPAADDARDPAPGGKRSIWSAPSACPTA